MILFCGLISLAFGQDPPACTFTQYPAEQGEGVDAKCVAAPVYDPDFGTCTNPPSGTPTLYGSVMNKANSIARVFKNYNDMHEGFYADKFDLDLNTFNIESVVDGRISYCTNNPALGSESGHCTEIQPAQLAQNYFYVDSGSLKLSNAVDMKLIGGPRHMIKLKTTSNCFIYYKVFIFPDPSQPLAGEISLLDSTPSNRILEHLGLPTSSLINNGFDPLFKLDIYDNVFCAIRDECRISNGICLYSSTDLSEKVAADMWGISTTSTEFGNPKIVSGPKIELGQSSTKEASLAEMAKRWYSQDDSGNWLRFAPQSPFCTIDVQFDWISYPGSTLVDDVNKKEILTIDDVNIEGAFQNILLADANISSNLYFQYEAYAREHPTEIESYFQDLVGIQDVDDLPAIFVEDQSCQSYLDCISTIGDQFEIFQSYENCKTGETLLTMNTDLFVVDGDRQIDNTNVDYELLPSASFELSGSAISCATALSPGKHEFTLKAVQDDREDRTSYLTVVVTIEDPDVDWSTIITTPDDTANYEYIDAPSYVRNTEDQSVFKLSIPVFPPAGQEVILLSKTPGYIFTDSFELLKTGGSSTTFSDTVDLVVQVLLLENGAVIAREDDLSLGVFNIEEKMFTTTVEPTTPVFTEASTEAITCEPCAPVVTCPELTTETPVTCPETITCPEITFPTVTCPEITFPTEPIVTCPEVTCPTYTCPEVTYPTEPTVTCPEATTQECPEVICPTFSPITCPTVTTQKSETVSCPACPEATCPVVSTTAPEAVSCPVCPETTCPVVTTTASDTVTCPIVTCPTFSPTTPGQCEPCVCTTNAPPTTDGDDDCELFEILTYVMSALTGMFLITTIVFFVLWCRARRDDDDNEAWVPESDNVEEEGTDDDEPVMEPLEPIGRPEVKVNETLVQEQYENTAFTSEEPKPKVVPVPVPMRDPSPPPADSPAVSSRGVPAPMVVPMAQAHLPVSDKLQDPIYHTLEDHEVTLKGVIKSGKIASVREVLLRKDGDTKHAVAVVLNVELATDKTFGEINKRIRIDTQISEMRHQNVLKYFGAWCEVDKLFMGYELAEKGKLDEHLRQTRLTGNAVSNMSNYQIMKILVNIVEGLAHLHSRGIIHGNLQASVIYLTEENIPKIGKVCNNQIKSNDRNLWRWWAPEVFENGQKHSREADIWAFGVVMWEVCTFGGLPYNDVDLDQLSQYVKYDRLGMPKNVSPEVYTFMTNCWKSDPRLRPDANQLVALLSERLVDDQSYAFLERPRDFQHVPTTVQAPSVKETQVYSDTISRSAF
ncbi:Oidioi.mRNA.OKI2018_I69.chr1.g1533.t1.cds [Oikopleura dioica]|uniref:Oidioi.mRNA.OKI2018_I69.chr1.g1533.t1.cds n=1 Tax=Oikopleura dioica TaxID=34765 RepID=A0ABN7SPX5_OIKDI|nr:Oidioi.mRNA.OKI2018_I69.chr1.g1533.t1.cds [Oikopleura dioica]